MSNRLRTVTRVRPFLGRGVLGATAAVVTMLVGIVGPTAAATAAEQSTDMRTATVDKAGVTLQFPSDWVDVSADDLDPRTVKQFLETHPAAAEALGVDPTASAKEIARQIRRLGPVPEFQAGDVEGEDQGENVVVHVFEKQRLDPRLDSYRKSLRANVEATGSTLLSVSETRVGKRKAYVSFEAFNLGRTPLIRGQMEIQAGPDRVATIGVIVDKQDRALADAIIGSVQPT